MTGRYDNLHGDEQEHENAYWNQQQTRFETMENAATETKTAVTFKQSKGKAKAYPKKLKEEVVKEVLSNGKKVKDLAEKLNIKANTITYWLQQHRKKVRAAHGARKDNTTDESKEKIEQLTRENETLKQSLKEYAQSMDNFSIVIQEGEEEISKLKEEIQKLENVINVYDCNSSKLKEKIDKQYKLIRFLKSGMKYLLEDEG